MKVEQSGNSSLDLGTGAGPLPDEPRQPCAQGGSKKPRKVIQSVARALDILEVLAQARGNMKLNDIAAQCSINASTCHHLLGTLTSRGYVARDSVSRTYFLSNKVIQLSQARVSHIGLYDVAEPLLRELNETTRESVNFGMLQAGELTFLPGFECRYAVKVDASTTGMSNAAHATATGKAIMAWLTETEIARVIAEKGMVQFTEKTVCTMAGLLKDLEQVRRRGYCVNHEEFRQGVTSFAAPVRDHTGAVIGAVSCTAPAFRVADAHQDLIVDSVKRCARIMSEQLGASVHN